MCGIVGIIGRELVWPRLLSSLKLLEYRGYDSAGIATLEGEALRRVRAEGKLQNLELRLREDEPNSVIGIGHTRWATHGKPNVRNAHPHVTPRVAVVHNGIFENFRELRAELQGSGVSFESETDSEVAAHLVTAELERGSSPFTAVSSLLPKLRGSFALAFLFAGEGNLLIAARRGSPLAIGHGNGEMFIASDAIALAPLTTRVSYLEDGDCAVVTRDHAEIRDYSGAVVERPIINVAGVPLLIDKGNYKHFMAKEIHEQPDVVGHTLSRYLDMAQGRIALPVPMPFDWKDIDRIAITGCGTAYYAGLVAKYWFERFARLAVEIDVASEFRYREAPFRVGNLALFVSQSGETADTLATLRYAREQQQRIVSVVNVPTSTIARESEVVLPTLAGPEIGVASTKAFTCQLSVLLCLALAAGRARGLLDEEDEGNLVRNVIQIPRHIAEALALESEIELLCRELSKARDVLYLGRGTAYPIALEGALKLKEISYIHAEGYAAGELKHGPIALIDEDTPVVVVAPWDKSPRREGVFEKTVSNMQEVAARGGKIVLITDERGQAEAANVTASTLILPRMATTVAPIVYSVPIQLIAYHCAVCRGTDVDQPRNLAKSVTVE